VSVNTDLSLISLLLNASPLVKLVMFILLTGSMLSWWYIFLKLFAIKRAQTMTDAFERNFWGGSDLNTLF
jgi:biopolymer transport protein TolQ